MKIKKYFLEEWRDVANYQGLYKVSSVGRVKSLERIVIRSDGKQQTVSERILKAETTKKGYLQVALCKNGKMKAMKVHRLVATAFIPNPNGYKEVNHKDEDKTNNRVENLEWVTASYNINYGTRNERFAKANKENGLYERQAKAFSKAVQQIDKESGEVIAEFPSVNEVQRQLGFDKGYISACCLGKHKLAYDYLWRYAS